MMVRVQALQTLSIMMQSLRPRGTILLTLCSQNALGRLLLGGGRQFSQPDDDEDELVGTFVGLLKALALRLDGDTLPYVPEYSVSLNGRYEFPFLTSKGGTGFVSGDLMFQGDQSSRLRPNDPTYREIDSYSLVNLRIGVETDSGWLAIAGIDNVLDEDETTAYTFNGNSQPNVGFVPPGEVRPWPRTLFVSLRRSF